MDPNESSSEREDLLRIISEQDREIAEKPKNIVASNRRGIASLGLQDYQQAIANFDQVIALDANYAAAYYNREQAYGLIREYQRAIADFERVITLEPDSTAGGYFGRGNTSLAMGDY